MIFLIESLNFYRMFSKTLFTKLKITTWFYRRSASNDRLSRFEVIRLGSPATVQADHDAG